LDRAGAAGGEISGTVASGLRDVSGGGSAAWARNTVGALWDGDSWLAGVEHFGAGGARSGGPQGGVRDGLVDNDSWGGSRGVSDLIGGHTDGGSRNGVWDGGVRDSRDDWEGGAAGGWGLSVRAVGDFGST